MNILALGVAMLGAFGCGYAWAKTKTWQARFLWAALWVILILLNAIVQLRD